MSTALAPNEVLAGRYEITGKLGEGGFGAVYSARHAQLGKSFAVKVLRPELAENATARERFLGEVRATLSFVHPYSIQIRDFGHDPVRNVLYFAMDLVEGETLSALLAREKRLSEERAVRLVGQVLEVLDKAYATGLVHRDLKPENLLVTTNARGEEEVRVLDFGIAKAIGDAETGIGGLTRPGTTLGTLFYMSPEQATGAALDGRSDLYSVGVILHECLAGRRPLEPDPKAENPLQNFHWKLASVVPDRLTGVSAHVAAAVAKALAKEPAGRHADAAAFRAALLAAGTPAAPPAAKESLTGLATVETPAAPPRKGPGPVNQPTFTGLSTGETPVPPRRSPLLVVAAVVGVVILGVALAATLRDPDRTWHALPAGGSLELVRVPGGEFAAGAESPDLDEEPRATRTLPEFWIGRTEVTWRAFDAYAKATGAATPPRPAWATDDHPVVNVTWREASDFCKWAGLRLPSEAEWEKAARGADGREHPWGAAPPSAERCVFQPAASPARVGSLAAGASPWGALDLAGNVWEWCADAHAAEGKPARRLRGGSYLSPPRALRTHHRFFELESGRGEAIGFRVARSGP